MTRAVSAPVTLLLTSATAVGAPAPRPPARVEVVAEQVRAAAPDFLFGAPRLTVGLRALWMNPQADSDIFDFVSEQLTLEKNDFRARGLAFDIGLPLSSRTDVLIGLDYNRGGAPSEVRAFVEADGSPIRQRTRLSQLGVSGSLELALLPRGRAIGQFAWVTAPVTPYVGAGGGLLYYRFEQTGDFVDSLDPGLPIFTARLLSEGWTTNTHVFGGVDVRMTRRLLLSAEARYLWADAETSLDFVGFEPLDLAGLRVTGGIQLLF